MQPNRFRLWFLLTFAVVAFCSVFVTTCGFLAEFHFGKLPYAVSLVRDQVTVRASFSDRVLSRLEQREQNESDPWARDDIRIAWSTVLYAERGEANPHFWATYNALRVSPDEVWPMIEARRRAALGSHYEEFLGVSSPPKKPVQSAITEGVQRKANAAAA